MAYVIERGVPMPTIADRHVVRERALSPLGAVFLEMEPGDSILTDKTLQAISAAAIKTGTNVTSRKEGSMYRVWKTECS